MEGQVLATQIREGVKPLLNEDEHREAVIYAINAMKVREKLSAKPLGKIIMCLQYMTISVD